MLLAKTYSSRFIVRDQLRALFITHRCTMSSVRARRYVLRSQFSGLPKREDFEVVEEELPPLKDGGEDEN